MRTEVKFSSRRFLMTLTLCACSVILLQNYNIAGNSRFPQSLLSVFIGLSICFLMFIPAIILKKRRDADVFTLLRHTGKAERYVTAGFYLVYFIFTALYFLIPYTDMFCKKYYPDASPCLIAPVLLVCCVYAAFKGANVITRFGVFLFALAMLTNALLFGGSLPALDFENGSFDVQIEPGSLLQNVNYFITPCFIAVIFACLSSYTRNFKFRQPLLALVLTGLKFALVLFFITFAVGEYALRQEYQTYVLARAAHFGTFAGIESFYMALSTMSVFMIVSLLLCCMCRSVNQNGRLPVISGFAAGVLVLYLAAHYFDSFKELLTNPLLLNILSFFAAVAVPLFRMIRGRGHA